MGYAMPPWGSNNKPMNYRENRNGIPWVIQLWAELTEMAAMLLVVIAIFLALFAIGLLLGLPRIATNATLAYPILYTIQQVPAWDFFSPLGFRLFKWTVA